MVSEERKGEKESTLMNDRYLLMANDDASAGAHGQIADDSTVIDDYKSFDAADLSKTTASRSRIKGAFSRIE
jgi:hypothetical protein